MNPPLTSTAQLAGLRGLRDPQVLALAAHEGRILVSHDVGTMPWYFRTRIDSGESSPGLFLIPQSVDIATAIEELLLIWLVSEAAEWESRLEWLPL